MKTTKDSIKRRFVAVALFVLGFTALGSAHAATYALILKNNGTALSCATGASFSFTKTTVGSFPTAMTVVIAGTGGEGCNSVLNGGTYSGSVNVVVENVTLNGQEQGPNVVGLQGTLTAAAGDTIAFDYAAGSASGTKPVTPGRTLTLTKNSQTTSANATYHHSNIATVPSPSAFSLAFAGLLAMFALGRTRRRT